MSISRMIFALALLTGIAAVPARAIPLADSISEFSGTQGSDGWYYGFYNRTADGPVYAAANFKQFANFDALNQLWQADLAQLNPPGTGFFNNTYLALDATGGHPTGIGPDDQDLIVWATRRYVSEQAGLLDILIDFHKLNINPNGNGTTAHVFVDGVEIFSNTIAGTDGLGVQTALVANVLLGSTIDFAIDPVGTAPVGNDNIASARADGTYFSAAIRTHELPVPPTLLLLAGGLAVLAMSRGSRRAVGGAHPSHLN